MRKFIIVLGLCLLPFSANAMGLCSGEKHYIIEENEVKYSLPHLSVLNFTLNGPLTTIKDLVIIDIHHQDICQYEGFDSIAVLQF